MGAILERRRFRDRRDAGRQLAEQLAHLGGEDALVLAMPRGGVPVGYEVARALGMALDVFSVRKLGAPQQPELGVGAVAPGGVLVLDADTIEALGISDETINEIAQRETQEMERRLRHFRGDRPMPPITGRRVILVDDGLATGVSALAAVRALRQLNPREIVLAVPVCAAQTAGVVRSQVEDLVCVVTPEHLGAVGLWYDDFSQTSDDEVVLLLEQARGEAMGGKGEQGGATMGETSKRSVRVSIGEQSIEGDLTIPPSPRGVALFAHGSGSSRHSPRNQYVAEELNKVGLATLLIDLLTPQEEAFDISTRHLRFDINLLADRLMVAIDWLREDAGTRPLPIGLFGASTGAAAALVAAAQRPQAVGAVVSRGGRPDLAGGSLQGVKCPVLLIVGGLDNVVLGLNEGAFQALDTAKELAIVPGATHLFEEPGTLEEVARLASEWFLRRLPTQ